MLLHLRRHAHHPRDLDQDDKLDDGAHATPSLWRGVGRGVADIPVMDNFLLDGVAWHIHIDKRLGARLRSAPEAGGCP